MATPMKLSIQINADGTAAIVGLKRVQGELEKTGKTANQADKFFQDLTGQLKSLALTAGSGLGLAVIAQSFIAATLEAQRLEKGLTAVKGSTALAAQEMAYIRETADRMGQAVSATAGAYLSLTAATKGTTLEGQASRDIFESVSLAMGKLGRSAADTQGALLAIEQMISKGKVSAEELRGQLGERLPGAFQAAADAMGVTTQELDKMLASGEVLAEDLLPALSRRLNELYDDGQEIGGLEAEWNRLKNAMADLAVTTDQATGATGALARAMQGATGLANDWAAAIRGVSLAQQGLGFTMAERDELSVLYRQRTQQVNDYLDAVERANKAGDLTKTPGLAVARDEALKALADTERSIQSMKKASKDAAAEGKKAAAEQAASMMDGPVKAYRAQKDAAADANQKLLELNGTYDKSAKVQAEAAKASLKYQEIAKALGKDEAWVAEQVRLYTAGLEANTSSQGKAAKARGGTSAATKAATKAEREHQQALEETNRAVQGLIARYLPARQAAEDYQEAQQAVNAALAGGESSLKLSAEEASTILAGLARDQAKAADAARRESDAFYAAWADAVDSLDDTFQGLWRGLVTGQGNVLDDIKSTLMEWLADLSYQLLINPLVLPIQTALLGGAGGGTGTTGGMAGGMSASGGSGYGSLFSSVGNLFGGNSLGLTAGSSLSSLMGAIGYGGSPAYASAITSMAAVPNWAYGLSGIAGGLVGNAVWGGKGYSGIGSTIGSTLGSFAGPAIAGALGLAGGASGAAAGAAMGSIVPGIGTLIGAVIGGIAGGGLGSLFGDDEPRYGRLMAATGGRYQELEDWQAGAYAKGAFGLNFGLSDAATKNVDATEYQQLYAGMAQVSNVIAEFFGPELAGKVETELARWPYLWGDEMANGAAGAMKQIFGTIADIAAGTGDDVGVIFERVLGNLTGTAEEMATQIEQAMATTAAILQTAKGLQGTDLAKLLGLSANLKASSLQLLSYATTVQRSGDTTAQAVQRLLLNLGGLEQALVLTGQQSDLTGQAYVDLSAQLALAAEAAGSDMAELVTAQTAYYQHFFTEEERATRVRDQAQAAIQDWNDGLGLSGEAIIATSAGLRAYVESLDLTTSAGREAYVSAMNISGSFITLDQALATLNETTQDATQLEKALAEQRKALAEQQADLEIELLRATQGEEAALAEQRRRELAAMDESLRPAQERIYAIEDEIRVMEEQIKQAEELSRAIESVTKRQEEAEIALLRARLGDAAALEEMRRREYGAANASLRPLLERQWAIEDETRALEEANAKAKELAQRVAEATRRQEEAEIALLRAREGDAAATAEVRRRELAAADESVRAILEHVWALEDEARALEEAARAAQQLADLQIRLAQAQGDGDLVRRLQREQELADASDDATRALLRQIYALEDEARAAEAAAQARDLALGDLVRSADAERAAINAQADARLAAIAAEREALSAAHQAAMDNLAAQRDSAQDALSAAEGLRSTLTSALKGVSDQLGIDELSRARAARQLGDWARQGRLPDPETLARAIAAATSGTPDDYATEAAFRVAQEANRSNLTTLEKLADRQVSDAERTVRAIEAQSAKLAAAQEAQLAALDAQAQQTEDWRDAQLTALDDLLATAEIQAEIAAGTYRETLTLRQALDQFNALFATTLDATRLGEAMPTPTLANLATAQANAAQETAQATVATQGEIVALRRDLAAIATAQTAALKTLEERTRKWDLDGLPPGRDDTTLLQVA